MDETTNAQSDPWVQEQLKAHVAHLTKHGLIAGHVRATVAWVLPNAVCLSRVGSKDNKNFAFWVISGKFATDHIARNLAPTPRAAVRHFALKWQLRASRLAERTDADQTDMAGPAAELEKYAQGLYALAEQDQHWLS